MRCAVPVPRVPPPLLSKMFQVGLVFGIELWHLLAGLRDQHVGYDAQPLN